MLNVETIGEFEKQYLSFEANCADEVSTWVSGRHKGFRTTPLERPGTGPVARFARAELDEISLVNFRWHQAFESEFLEELDAYFVCVPHAGKMKMQLAHNDEIVQTTDKLRVFKRSAGLKNTVAPGFSNLSLVVPANLLERRLQSRIGAELSERQLLPSKKRFFLSREWPSVGLRVLPKNPLEESSLIWLFLSRRKT